MPEVPHADREGTSIILVGAFNPRIFHPSWFVRYELLPETAEEASVEVVSNELAAFDTDWFHLEVLPDRLMLASMSAPVVDALRDLLLGTFRILRHTPVHVMGINTHAHFGLHDEAHWNQFGHALAPKGDLWDPVLERPGTRSLTIEGVRPDKFAGSVKVKVEPSMRVQNGIFIETNDEYQNVEATSADWIQDVLVEHWEESHVRADAIRAHIVSRAMYGGELT